MAILEVLIYPDERLKTHSMPVVQFDDALQQFLIDLEETMRASPGGVGIAAPQVSNFQRIVIVDVSSKPKIKHHHGRLILINPEITHWSGFAMGREGCISVPDYTGNVIRAQKIQLTAQDEQGIIHDYHLQGYEARAVQHEIDHLNGLLFIDRLVSHRHDLFKRQVYQN
ncbi:MAG: peptide deformylase [Pseudomonadota bacterium]|nr:peptide deformylase [Pseudomonadota bacterium]